MIKLDLLDQSLLRLLRSDGRMPVAELARELSVSRTTIQDRVKRLEERGIIHAYTIVVNLPDADLNEPHALLQITAEPIFHDSITRALKLIPEVNSVWAVSGPQSLLVDVRATTFARIDRIIVLVSEVSGVSHVEANMILSRKFSREVA